MSVAMLKEELKNLVFFFVRQFLLDFIIKVKIGIEEIERQKIKY